MGHIEKYEALLQKFVLWAKRQDDIRAAIVLGSRARAVGQITRLHYKYNLW